MQDGRVPPGSYSRRERLGRQRHIVSVLSRHGFGLLVQRSRLPIIRRAALLGRPLSLRNALEELGTTFVKLGQILSTRPDLLPDEYVRALATLQDALAPISLADVLGVIEREFGRPVAEVFRSFDPLPLATASIGQVHAAVLPDGTLVAVKVQKPGIVAAIDLDLQIIHDLARLAAARIDLPLMRNVEALVEQFADGLREEVDYLHEAHNAERFARCAGTEPFLSVPTVFWAYTTSRVLTLSRLEGAKIGDMESLDARGIDRRLLAQRLSHSVLRQVFEYGYFHADPHPGNFLVRADGTIGIVDYGLMGNLDTATRRELLMLLAAWVRGDADGLADGLLILGVVRTGSQGQELRSDMRRVLGRYHEARLEDINLAQVMADLFRLARRHQLVLRGDLALMAKTLAMHEGLGSRLDPRFHLVEEARPYVESALRRLYLPHPDAQAAAMGLGAMIDLATGLPQRALRLLGRVERGDIGLAVRPEGIEPLIRDLNHMVNRLSVSILAAAFIIGLALLLQVVETSHGSLLLLLLFTAGLVGAALLGLWIMVSMYRAGQHR
jgi:ubiquinone biosynthesis protein